MRVSLKSGFFYFLFAGTMGVVLGVLREMFVVPALGRLAAVVLEVPVMLLLCWFACIWLLALLDVPRRWHVRLGIGLLAFVLLMIFETLLRAGLQFAQGEALDGIGFAGWGPADYVGFAGQVLFSLLPLVTCWTDTPPEPGTHSATPLHRVRVRQSVLHQAGPARRS